MNTTTTLEIGAALVAVAAAAKGLWSPCGLSMLSTLTPLGERGRGHSYRPAAAWFIAGAIAGGLCLGAAVAGLAALVAATGLPAAARAAAALVAATIALCSDSPTVPIEVPIHRRQVNERWLDHYRTWVYGAGFGWQIGTGLATYVTSAGVYLMIALAALTGAPWVALAIGAIHGTARGMGVLVSARVKTPDDLLLLHRHISSLAPAAQCAVLVAESAVIAAAVAMLTSLPLAIPIAVGAVLAVVTSWTALARRTELTAAA